MNTYYVPINGYLVIEATDEQDACDKARVLVTGFDYDIGYIALLNETESEEEEL